mmetsp:Transcript_12661/g.22733  ORF Transcript_12661/g.22733 Transcript_12661/m.22733 type:complete len:653 (-) Transcript_12661:5-1963(-)
MATTSPAELRVGLCGRAARVPLRPDEGIGDLRARVADAFGLTAPFDLLGPEGMPLRSDQDAVRTAASWASQEVTVEAGEDVLLDLERAHEETGAIRWVMLRKVIAGLRRQIAEANAAISDAQHRAAVLDEKFVREKQVREAGDSALRSELDSAIKELGLLDARRRQEFQASVDSAVVELKEAVDVAEARHAANLSKEVQAVKEELAQERVDRSQADAEGLERLRGVQVEVQQEAAARVESLQKLEEAIEVLRNRIEAERQDRRDLQDRTQSEKVELGVLLDEEKADRQGEMDVLKQEIKKIEELIGMESSERSGAVDLLKQKIQDTVQPWEDQLGEHQAEMEKRLSVLEKVEGNLQMAVEKEYQHLRAKDAENESAIRDLERSLREEVGERRALEQRTTATFEDARNSTASERSTREQQIAERIGAERQIASQIQAMESMHLADVSALSAEANAIREELEREQERRRTACQEVASATLSKLDGAMVEVRRMHDVHADEQRNWAKVLIDKVTADLRVERETVMSDVSKHIGQLGVEVRDKVRTEVMEELRRVEGTTAELIQAEHTARCQDRAQQEHQSRMSAEEIKKVLQANSECMEVLGHEQRLLINRLNEGLALEDRQRDELGQRFQLVECDMQKVRSHLPILFAAPKCFR